MITETLASAVATAVKKLYDIKITPEISYPDPKFGDFSTNVAFRLAPELKQKPNDTAEKLAKTIKHRSITSVETAGGFINIRLSDQAWAKAVAGVEDGFGRSNRGKGVRVQVEFISANPTGPLTLGNGRGGYSGDTLANVLTASGFEVNREYYLNDTGGQVERLINSIKIAAGEAEGEPDYRGEYITELAQGFSLPAGDKKAEQAVVSHIIERMIKPPIETMGIKIDSWFSESQQLHAEGKVEAMLKMLKEKQLTEEKDGALWLRGDKSDDKGKVLVKSDGAYTYLLVDIAYHWNKLIERKFDKVINLWGADHAAQVAPLKSALAQLGVGDRLDIVIFQLVRLIKGGAVVKVSKRAGTYVALEELLEEIPSDVARFFFLMRSHDTHMDFNLDLAKEHSHKNPYHYVMYSYVRAQSILEEAAKKQLQPAKTVSHQLSDKERSLIRYLLRLPEIVAEISKNYEVHQLTFYGMELARFFHDYYEETRIISLPEAEAQSRLVVINKFKIAMEFYFSLLGVKPLERM